MRKRWKASPLAWHHQVRAPGFEGLEARQLLDAAGLADVDGIEAPPAIYATGADAGAEPLVRVFDAVTGGERLNFFAYDPNFRGGVRVALGDVSGDGFADIITAPGPGGGPHIRVFDGLTGQQIPGKLGSFMAYDISFLGGVFVAAADFGTGKAEIITGPGEGSTPEVRLFWEHPTLSDVNRKVGSFLAYDAAFRGGVRVATGDVDSDGDVEIITGAGPGGGPHVRVFAERGMICDRAFPGTCYRLFTPASGFYAYDPAFTGGVYVAAADVNGDQKADIITGAGAGGGPHVKAFSGLDGNHVLASFMAYDESFWGGVRVGADDIDGDGRAEILTAPGRGREADLCIFDAQTGQLREQRVYDKFLGGAFVAGLNGPQFEPTNHAPEVIHNPQYFSVRPDAPNTVLNLNGAFADRDELGTLLRFDTTLGSFGVELFDTATPETVASFLNSVRDGDFDDTLIHGADEFVVRGGGYRFPGFGEVPADPPIEDEVLLANRRNTLAMARPTGEPDSATGQWFINRRDNSASLDQEHTVFGRVFPIATYVVNDIGNLPTFDLSNRMDLGPNRGAFGQFPLRNYTDADLAAGAPITENNVVLVDKILDDPSLSGARGGDRLLNLSARSSNPSLVSVSLSNGLLTLDYNPLRTGWARITVRATDVHGAFAETYFDVLVDSPFVFRANAESGSLAGSAVPHSSDKPFPPNDCGCGGSTAVNDAVFAKWDG